MHAQGGCFAAMERRSAYFTVEARDRALPLVVTSVGLNQEQHGVTREKGYESFHFFRCIGGEGAVRAGRREFPLRENMGMILLPDEPHSYAPVREPWLVDWITFTGGGASSILSYLEISRSEAFDLPDPDATAAVIAAFDAALALQGPTVKLDVSCRLYELLASLHWNAPAGRSPSGESRYSRLEPVLRYIEQNYAQPLTLELLAEQAGVTPRHLCVLFREALHTRPFRYVNTVRINKGKRLLLEDRDRSVRDVAALCGYDNICYFNQTFRTIAGMSPTEFRLLH